MDHETKIESISIDKIEPIVYVNFKDDDTDRISKSIKEIGYEPVIARPKGKRKYQLCSHPEILEALKLLGEKTIDCIIQDISEQQGKELSVTSLLRVPEISPNQQEYLVWTLYNSGCYKSHADLGRKLGITGEHVSRLCYAKEQREKLFGTDVTSDDISTETLRLIKSLSDDEQKRFCERIFDGNIYRSDTREAVEYLTSKSVPEASKRDILTGIVPFRKVKEVMDQRFSALNELYCAAEKKLQDPKTSRKIIQDETTNYTSEPFRLLAKLFGETSSKYIENIPDELERHQVDCDLNIISVLVDELRYHRGLITSEKYKERLQEVNFTVDDISLVKEDGHRYGFEDEWLTKFEEKFQEKLRKLITSNDPFVVVV